MTVRVTATSARRTSLIATGSPAGGVSVRLDGFSQGLNQLAQLALVTRDRQERSITQRELTNFRLETTRRFDERAQGFTGDGSFAEPFLEETQGRISELTAKIGNPRIKRQLEETLNSELPSLLHGAQNLETSRQRQFILNNADETAQSTRNNVLNDPSSRESARETIHGLADTLPGYLRQQFIEEQNREIDENFIEGRIRQDPYGFSDELLRNELVGELDGDQLRRARKRVDSEIARIEAERARKDALSRAVRSVQLRALIDDDLASVESSGEGLDGELLSVAEITDVLGADDAERYVRARETARSAFEAIDGIADESPSLIAERLERLQPTPGTAGFADQQKIFENAQRRVAAEFQSRQQDPAAHYLAADPQIQAIQQSFQIAAEEGDPVQAQIFERLARLQDARQEFGGVAPSQRRLLPQAQARAIVAQVAEGEPETRAQRLRDFAASLDARYGRESGRVLNELVDAGLPAETHVLRALGDDPAAATRVARALDQKKAVADLLDTDQTRRTTARVTRSLDPLIETLLQAPDGADLASEYRETMIATANYLVAVEGMSPNKAAREATRPFIEAYTFEETYRVPNAWNARDVENGARAVIDGLIRDNGAALAPNAGRADLAEAQRRMLYADVVEQTGVWRTNEDETGLVLVDDFGRPVIDADGAIVERSFDDLIEMSGRAAATRRGSRSGFLDPERLF